jgi:hypothetical protein
MPKTQVSCPNCRQPVVAEIEQLFDLNVDPQAKSRLLSGASNLIQCQVCGYQGSLPTPIVYHDPDKEMLLTFVPAELGLPRNEQERLIGSMINQVINKLPQEKRKGYLLNPQATLTMQGLIERILEGDGITREMLQAQQRRLSLLQRLASATDEKSFTQIAQQEDALIDADFFGLLSRVIEASLMNGDRESARQLNELQRRLLPITTYGAELQAQSKEVEGAIEDLRAAGENLSREKLLELILDAKNETRLRALVSLARPAMDYAFFQLLSERIDRARSDGRARLVELRTKLLEMTQEIDKQIEAHRQESRQVIDAIIQTDDIPAAMEQVLQGVDEIFVKELQSMLAEARKNGDLGRSAKLQQMVDYLQKASAPPPEVDLIEEYLDVADEAGRQEFLKAHDNEVNEQFMDMLGNIAMQVEAGEDVEIADRVAEAHRSALRYSMQRSMRIS